VAAGEQTSAVRRPRPACRPRGADEKLPAESVAWGLWQLEHAAPAEKVMVCSCRHQAALRQFSTAANSFLQEAGILGRMRVRGRWCSEAQCPWT